MRNISSLRLIIITISLVAATGIIIAVRGVALSRRLQSVPSANNSHTGVIEGRVLNDNGQPVPDVTVFLIKVGELKSLFPTATSDHDGKFSIDNLSPGAYEVRGSKEAEGYPDSGSAFYSRGLTPQQQTFVLEGQVTSNVIVQLTKTARLTGRVVDAATGKPIENGHIILRRADQPKSFYRMGLNQRRAKGVFNLLAPPAPFTITVSAPSYEDWTYVGSDNGNRTNILQLGPEQTKDFTIALHPAK